MISHYHPAETRRITRYLLYLLALLLVGGFRGLGTRLWLRRLLLLLEEYLPSHLDSLPEEKMINNNQRLVKVDEPARVQLHPLSFVLADKQKRQNNFSCAPTQADKRAWLRKSFHKNRVSKQIQRHRGGGKIKKKQQLELSKRNINRLISVTEESALLIPF